MRLQRHTPWNNTLNRLATPTLPLVFENPKPVLRIDINSSEAALEAEDSNARRSNDVALVLVGGSPELARQRAAV